MAEINSYTPEDVAGILKISRFTVYELIKRGELIAYHIGRKVRVEPTDLDRYKQNAKSYLSSSNQAKAKTSQLLYNSVNDFIICGQDIVLDSLTSHLDSQFPHSRFLRHYIDSIPGLLSLYQGSANLVTAHLWDGDSGEYNSPYVRRLLPGQRTLIYNLVYRYEGFYVSRGNPQSIQTWSDLSKPGIRLVNRECGSGARVLLDEQLRKLQIESSSLPGYTHEETSHLAVASCIARGEADIGLGTEKAALQVDGVDFIPLQKERYDLVIRKEDLNKPPFQALIAILQSTAFRNEISGMGGYDISKMGQLMAEF